MLRTILLLVAVLIAVLGTARVSAQTNPLSVDAIEVTSGVGDFGQPVMRAVGILTNHSDTSAYIGITLNAEAYDATDTLIGDGIGVLADACGIGLLPDFALQPGAAQPFSAPLELFDPEATIARVVITASAQAASATPSPPLADGIDPVTSAEAVNVEWIDAHSFRYATGCATDLFIDWTWQVYDVTTASTTAITPPHAGDVTDALRQRLQLTDDQTFAHSLLRYAPDGQRLVYQNARNDFQTASTDGTFRRALYTGLHNQSLQGVYWLPEERFLAYYYGAFGDPVSYFTATAASAVISPPISRNPPSLIVPGVSRDARRVVIAGDFDDGLGYYLYVVTNGFFEQLFVPADIPGNNYPAPLLLSGGADDLITRVYAAIPVDGVAQLQCFNRDEGVLYDLAPLPLDLGDSDRAWWWLSPDDSMIALAANGVNGGLWRIDLTALPACAGA